MYKYEFRKGTEISEQRVNREIVYTGKKMLNVEERFNRQYFLFLCSRAPPSDSFI